mgnify:CR=1 FL=1|tara:strand:- start:1385 stop:1633 length:249 start_codon:yes stop_codon:yes gene_type:complete
MKSLKRRLSYYNAYLSYFIIAGFQIICPTVAADPASKINPPEWSEVQEQTQAQRMREIAGKSEEIEERQIEESEKFINSKES